MPPTAPPPPSLEAARAFLARGWTPVPVQRAELGNGKSGKRPLGKAWQTLAPELGDLPRMFRPGRNVGIILGEASGGLVDVDLDCAEAVELAPLFLPPTPMRHGRGGMETHRWYQCPDDPRELHPFALGERAPGAKRAKHKMLVEVRSGARARGFQTVVPPSVHFTGATLQWSEAGPPHPACVPHAELVVAAGRLALACALLRSFWTYDAAVAFAQADAHDWQQVPPPVLKAARKWGIAPEPERRVRAPRAPRNGASGASCSERSPLTDAVVAAVSIAQAFAWLGLEPLDELGRARCPVHGGSNSTSFTTAWHTHLWKCHSTACLASGDVIHIVEAVRGVDRLEARRWLAEGAGLDWRAILEEQHRDRGPVEAPAPVLTEARYCVTRPSTTPLARIRGGVIASTWAKRLDVLDLDTRTAGSGKSTGAGYALAAAHDPTRDAGAEWRAALDVAAEELKGKGRRLQVAVAAASHRQHDEEWLGILARGSAKFGTSPTVRKTPRFACVLPVLEERKRATKRYHAVRAAGFNPIRVVCARCPHFPDTEGGSRKAPTCTYHLEVAEAWDADIVLAQHRHMSTSLDRVDVWIVDEDPGDALDPEACVSRAHLAPFAELVEQARDDFLLEISEHGEHKAVAELAVAAADSAIAVIDAFRVQLDDGPEPHAKVAALAWVENRATSGLLEPRGRRALVDAMHRSIRDNPTGEIPRNFTGLCLVAARGWARGEALGAVWRRGELGVELIVPVPVELPKVGLRVLDATGSCDYWRRRTGRRVDEVTGGRLLPGRTVQIVDRIWSRKQPHLPELAFAIATWVRRYGCRDVGIVFYMSHLGADPASPRKHLLEGLVPDIRAQLRRWRYPAIKVRALYWGHLRGSNKFRGCDAVFVAGTPYPGRGCTELRALAMGATAEDVRAKMTWGAVRLRVPGGDGPVVSLHRFENQIMGAAFESLVDAEHTQGVARGTRGELPPRGLVVFSSRRYFSASAVERTTLAAECLTPVTAEQFRRVELLGDVGRRLACARLGLPERVGRRAVAAVKAAAARRAATDARACVTPLPVSRC